MLGLIAAALLVGGFGPVEASALAAVVALIMLVCFGWREESRSGPLAHLSRALAEGMLSLWPGFSCAGGMGDPCTASAFWRGLLLDFTRSCEA